MPLAPRRRTASLLGLVLLISLAWLTPGLGHAAVGYGGQPAHSPNATNLPVSDTPRSTADSPRQDTSYGLSCISSSDGGCFVSVDPSTAFNAIGQRYTATLTCGVEAETLSISGTASANSGCFDVAVKAQDVTNGTGTDILSAKCAGSGAPIESGSSSCASVANPICAGAALQAVSGTCAPVCPAGFGYQAADNLCHAAPTGSPPTCPTGSTPVNNASGVPIDCTEAPLSVSENVVAASIDSGAPHVYRFNFTGFIGALPSGACPNGTTFTSGVNLTPTGGALTTGTACAFTLSVQVEYLDVTGLTTRTIGFCGGGIALGLTTLTGGTPCFFNVEARGFGILKSEVDCATPGEPVTGSSAGVNFPIGSVYDCSNSNLSVTNVPVPGIVITLQVVNGVFPNNCIPNSRLVTPDTPAATPDGIPTAASTIAPSPTPTMPSGSPTPMPVGSSRAAFCGPPGTTAEQVITDGNGIAGEFGTTVQFGASANLPFILAGNDETIAGRFLVDQGGIAGIPMYAASHFIFGTIPCDTSSTNAAGTAQCVRNTGIQSAGSTVPVAVSFIYDCTEYDIGTSFTIGEMPAATTGLASEPAPAGLCVVRTGYGKLTVAASYASAGDSQQSVSSGPAVLGQFGLPAATPFPTWPPVPTSTSIPPTELPSSTPDPIPTFTPMPTATSTPVPTATFTPLPTPLPTPRPLSFSLDAARVATADNPGNGRGLDVVGEGQKVRLMIYYTILSVPHTAVRITKYEIIDGDGHEIFGVSFKGKELAGEAGRFIRFTYYTAPAGLPFGVYQFRGTLTIAGHARMRTWRFAVTNTPHPIPAARGTKRHNLTVQVLRLAGWFR